jgi:hypothetical protein
VYLLPKKTHGSGALQGLGCSSCGGRCGGALQGLGFAVGEPAPGTAATAVPVALTTPAAILQQQINRFAPPSAPAGLQFVSAPIPITGVLDPGTALVAVLIAQRRAADALARYADNVSGDVLKQATSAIGAPVPFVQAHLGELITIVSNYADAKGLPRSTTEILGPSTKKALLIAGGLAVGALFFLRKKRRS